MTKLARLLATSGHQHANPIVERGGKIGILGQPTSVVVSGTSHAAIQVVLVRRGILTLHTQRLAMGPALLRERGKRSQELPIGIDLVDAQSYGQIGLERPCGADAEANGGKKTNPSVPSP